MTTQTKELLYCFQAGMTISPAYAMSELGIMRLAARVYDLRKMGHDIRSNKVSYKNKFGRTVTYFVYFLYRGGDDEVRESV